MLALSVGIVSPVNAAPVAASEARQGRSLDQAKTFISDLTHQSLGVFLESDRSTQQKHEMFSKIWRDGVALDAISRFVLGRYWRAASPEQRVRYQELFSASMTRTSANVLASFGKDELLITGARLAGKKDILVSTRIERQDGPPVPVDWRVRIIDHRYQIIDVMIEGVSMALTKRSEYSSVIKNQGFEGLLTAMKSTI